MDKEEYEEIKEAYEKVNNKDEGWKDAQELLEQYGLAIVEDGRLYEPEPMIDLAFVSGDVEDEEIRNDLNGEVISSGFMVEGGERDIQIEYDSFDEAKEECERLKEKYDFEYINVTV